MGVPDHEGRTGNLAYLASEGRSRQGPYPHLLPGLRALENVGTIDARQRIGRRAQDPGGGIRQDQKRRRGPTHTNARWPTRVNALEAPGTGENPKSGRRNGGHCTIAEHDPAA